MAPMWARPLAPPLDNTNATSLPILSCDAFDTEFQESCRHLYHDGVAHLFIQERLGDG